MILDDIATAYKIGGFNFTVVYDTLISKDVFTLQKGAVKRFLCSGKMDLNHQIAKASLGEIEARRAQMVIFAEKPQTAIEDLKTCLKEIYKTDRGFLGKGSRYKDYNGVRFWIFEPSDGTIKETADFWQPAWGSPGGYYVADCELTIAAAVIT